MFFHFFYTYIHHQKDGTERKIPLTASAKNVCGHADENDREQFCKYHASMWKLCDLPLDLPCLDDKLEIDIQDSNFFNPELNKIEGHVNVYIHSKPEV